MLGGSRHGRDQLWIQDLLRPFLVNHPSVFACGDVTKDHAVTELNVLEEEAGDGCFVGGDFFQGSLVESLLAIVDDGRETAETSGRESS